MGAEYRWGGAFTVGLALSAAEADVTMRSVGKADIDSVALIPYFSYYRSNVFPGGILDYEARLGSDNENHYIGLKVGKEF